MSRARIGFALLTHDRVEQAVALMRRLNELYGEPPIVWHHDLSKSPLPTEHVPGNVRVVRPHVSTSWGDMSIVAATVRCLATFFEDQGQQGWCVLLSGSDYPVLPAPRVLRDLDAPGVDAHVEYAAIDERALDAVWCAARLAEDCPSGRYFIDYGQKYFRYLSVPLTPSWSSPRAGGRRIYNPRLLRWLTPFSPAYRCHVGSQWMTFGRRAALVAIDEYRTNTRLVRHFARTGFGDEAFFHTVLANSPAIRCHQNSWRYTDWSARAAHPKVLDEEDLPAVFASGAHFARKVDPDQSPAVPRLIDDHVSLLMRDIPN